MMDRLWPLLLSILLWSACGDESVPQREVEGTVEAGEAPAPDPIETRVFMREPDNEAGPGRLVVHFLVPGDATHEQLRQALVRNMEEAAQTDTSLIAVRAVAYAVAEPQPGGTEADLVPLGWGEWVPPGGWSGQGSRDQLHRFHTYSGVAPEW